MYACMYVCMYVDTISIRLLCMYSICCILDFSLFLSYINYGIGGGKYDSIYVYLSTSVYDR